MYNILLDDPPEDYKGIPIKTDFRQGLKIYRNLGDDKLTEKRRGINIILCLFGKIPPFLYEATDEQVKELWEFIDTYLSAGEKAEVSGTGERLFDFNADHSRVYAAFYQVYGIDLISVKMHWWQFYHLFQCLPKGTHLSDVIDIRGKEVPAKGDQKYRRQLLRLKRLYSISPKSSINQSDQAVNNFVKGFFK